ncbi:fungal zn(2)-Cys(6) binuclear cluster domain-containing protein [Sarocladium implicatum]|nr:fungal zn(2)-Cys(6) binuclear cluster domain-containing protein [Sarocladium implicatum]
MHGRFIFEVGSGEEGYDSPRTRTRPFYPKRSHKKSRKGCVNCKTRKVKCDETLPACRSCALRRDACVYVDAAPVTRVQQPRRHLTFVHVKPAPASSLKRNIAASLPSEGRCESQGQSVSPLLASGSLGMLPPSASLEAVDMKLIWNYTVKTVCSFVADEKHQYIAASIYRNEVVSLAFDSPFLLNSILALSCLELQKIDRRFSLELAYSYHLKAVEGYNRAISEARPETFPAIMANALFVGFLTSHTFRDPKARDLYIADWLSVWRGVVSIVEMVGIEMISELSFGVILYRSPIDLEASALAVPEYLRSLIDSITETDEDYPSIAAYTTTLTLLGSLYLHLGTGLGSDLDHRVACWPSLVPRAFAHLAQQHRPRALIILAHLGCFFKLMTIRPWWIEGVGERTISDILKHLAGTPWMDALKIPLAVETKTRSIDIARALLGNANWVNPERSQDQMNRHYLYIQDEDPITASAELLRVEHEKDNEMEMQVDADISRRLGQAQVC